VLQVLERELLRSGLVARTERELRGLAVVARRVRAAEVAVIVAICCGVRPPRCM
jgi:hypothetical protein